MFFDGAEGAAMAQEKKKKLPVFNIKTTNIIMAKPLIGGLHSHSAKTPRQKRLAREGKSATHVCRVRSHNALHPLMGS